MSTERIAALRLVHEQVDAFQDALQQITQAQGRFNRDGVEHMRNCLQDMQAIAINVLRKYGIKPIRDDDPINGEPVPMCEFERSDVA